MACKRYTVNEVVAELYGSNFEDSEDDFDGYLDMESDNNVYTQSPKERLAEVLSDVGEEYIRIDPNAARSYTLPHTLILH